jgi:hypothetical protein
MSTSLPSQVSGELEKQLGHPREAEAVDHHDRERIEHARVEATGDEDDVGVEPADRRRRHALDRGLVGAVPGARRQRDVDGAALAGPGAGVLDGSRVGGIEVVLV